MLQKLVIIGFLVVIVYNLASSLYYMMTDKGESDRMVKALTWRIGLSIVLIALIGLGIWSGWIQPHGVDH
ncbi:MAG: twin transmembrane helix small protein [Proteobacteria bacterium]|nr:twin transmembrane helix small protein [Pseudomonadota bacterium]